MIMAGEGLAEDGTKDFGAQKGNFYDIARLEGRPGNELWGLQQVMRS